MHLDALKVGGVFRDSIMKMRFSRLHRRKKRRKIETNPKKVLVMQILIGVSLAVFIVLIGVGVWHGSRVSMFTISEVEVVGGETISHDDIRKIAEEKLEGAYYKFVPKHFSWTYPRKKIESSIREIERIKNVHVENTSGTKIVIIFEEYRPFALWCENIDSSECLFLDREGFAFTMAPKLYGAAFVRFSEVGRVPEISTQSFDGEYIRNSEAFIQSAYDKLLLNIIQVEKTAEDEIVYHISGGGKLKVSLRMATEDTLDNLSTILSSKEFEHIEPGNFQYIDLRYGNKVFVNEEEPNTEIASSTATST